MILRFGVICLCATFGFSAIGMAQTSAQAAMDDLLQHRRICYSPQEVDALRQEMSSLLERANTRGMQLLEFESELASRAEKIAHEQARLSDLIEDYNQKMAYAETAAIEDIKSLAGVYEAMEPRVAAQSMASMPPSFSAGLVRHMDEQKAARILCFMAPNAVGQLSMTLASRNTRTKGDLK